MTDIRMRRRSGLTVILSPQPTAISPVSKSLPERHFDYVGLDRARYQGLQLMTLYNLQTPIVDSLLAHVQLPADPAHFSLH